MVDIKTASASSILRRIATASLGIVNSLRYHKISKGKHATGVVLHNTQPTSRTVLRETCNAMPAERQDISHRSAVEPGRFTRSLFPRELF